MLKRGVDDPEGETLDAIGAWSVEQVTRKDSGGAERIRIARVTPSLLTMLRAVPANGRMFVDGDENPGGTKVAIDGQDQNVGGTVVCTAMGGNMNIAIGDAATGIAAVVSEDGSNVQSVGLGNVNGVTLGYQSGTGQGEAKAEKSYKTWKISGTATGIDMANPMQPVNKPFEIEVTCP